MSKIIDELSPEDFGKSFDTKVFEEWKISMQELQKISIIAFILQLVGLAILVLLGGFIGLALFFTVMIIAMVMSLSKRKVVKQYQNKLGFTNEQLKKAISIRRKKVK